MNEITKNERIANIITFFTIIFGGNRQVWKLILEFYPDYIIEKFERYVLSTRVEYPWGMHPAMIENYCEHNNTYPDFDCLVERCLKCKEIAKDE